MGSAPSPAVPLAVPLLRNERLRMQARERGSAKPQAKGAAIKQMTALTTVDVTKSYKGRKVVSDVNLVVGQGEVVGLLGPNGAGKTTTFYMIVGLARPDSGSVLLGGDDITDLPMYVRAKNGISYLP